VFVRDGDVAVAFVEDDDVPVVVRQDFGGVVESFCN
jgi:hypothetical protein